MLACVWVVRGDRGYVSVGAVCLRWCLSSLVSVSSLLGEGDRDLGLGGDLDLGLGRLDFGLDLGLDA